MNLATVSSTAFRLVAFLFLRIIPTTLVRPLLPALFVIQLYTSRKLLKPGTLQKSSASDVFYDVLLSRPSHSKLARNLSVLLNVLIALAVLDFAFTPFLDPATGVRFTRIGAVYPDSAKIVLRYPEPNSTVQLLWRQATNETEFPWRDGPAFHLAADQDWIDTVKLAGLWPSTSYEYILADSNRTKLAYPANPIAFHTFPDPRLPTGNKFQFAASSCITPNFPYFPFSSRRIKGFDLLAKHLKDHPLEFLMFLGDFIYADVPIYTGNTAQAYKRLYRRNYNSPSYRNIYEHLPVFHIYDDHEIFNDYEGKGNDSSPPFPAALSAFEAYSGDANYDPLKKGQQYYNFHYGDTAFFVLDTRRYRTRDSEDSLEHTMLGDSQLSALYDWLGHVNTTSTFKFIISSVPLTSLWSYGSSDSWAGYPAEKSSLLRALHSVPNVIVVSGDRHEFAHIEINTNIGHKINEISTSPLSMFYIPFVRTLRRKSSDVVELADSSTVPREHVLKSIASGNYKWSTFEVDTTNRAKPTVRVKVMIEGQNAHNIEIQGSPVKLQSSTALGALLPTSFKEIFDRIGMQSTRWF